MTTTQTRVRRSIPARVGERPRLTGWLDDLNHATDSAAADQLRVVCSSRSWAEQVAAARPFADADELLRSADAVWLSLEPTDWLQALAGHPRIGEQGGSAADHSRREQAGLAGTPAAVLDALADGNRRYEAKFGHVFLIAAAGRSAEEISAELTRRLDNAPDQELREAAEEHRRITRLRLERLLAGSSA